MFLFPVNLENLSKEGPYCSFPLSDAPCIVHAQKVGLSFDLFAVFSAPTPSNDGRNDRVCLWPIGTFNFTPELTLPLALNDRSENGEIEGRRDLSHLLHLCLSADRSSDLCC